MYGKETLELEDARQMLHNNEMMKKIDSTEEPSELFVKGQRERSKNRGPKRNPKAYSSFFCYFCKKLEHIKKIVLNTRKCWKGKAAKILMGLVPVESQIKSE